MFPILILPSSQNAAMVANRKKLLIALGKFWAHILSNATNWALALYEFGVMIRLSHVCQVKGLGSVGNMYDSTVG